MDFIAVASKIVNGLAGTADPVLPGVGEPVQARSVGHGLELLAHEEPVGQVCGDVGGGGGHESVVGVGAEAEVVGQKRGILSGAVSGALPRRGAQAAERGGW